MTDEEFEKSVADKQHNDLLRAIKSITIPAPDNSGVISAIRENSAVIGTFVTKLQEISRTPSIEFNNGDVVKCISDMADRIDGSLKMLMSKLSEPKAPIKLDLIVNRSNGYISGIKIEESK